MTETDARLERLFPNLVTDGYDVKSPVDPAYNCIAYAAGENMRKWWPVPVAPYFWPPELPRLVTLENFRDAFALKGYEVCDNGDVEDGFEKIAIYIGADQLPSHAARQLPSGAWISKLGQLQDIEHSSVAGVEGDEYGQVAMYLRRARRVSAPTKPAAWPF